MASSFVIYVDESGDEGFKFRPRGNSSDWFVISGVVVRRENDFQLVSCMDQVRSILNRKPKTPLHFVDMKHPHRVVWVHEVAKLPIRTITVLVHKPSVPDPRVFINDPCHMYRYASRLLIERCSWFCRDHFNGNGDSKAQMIFSNRDRMSYDDLTNYWGMLRQGISKTAVKISWSHIDTDNIVVRNHDQLAGLQIADCVASSQFNAVNLGKYGHPESGYSTVLLPTLYRHNGSALSYGLKFMPNLTRIRPSNPHLRVFDGLK